RMTRVAGGYRVRLDRRINVRIDGALLREIAETHGLQDMMETCFRWKPELIRREWRQAENSAKQLFAPAVVMTPGRASFTVTPRVREE
nr:hypothetical protein [Fretibacterium sp.]